MIKRRRLLKALVAAPAMPSLLAQQAPPQSDRPRPDSPVPPPSGGAPPPSPYNRTPPASVEAPKLDITIAEEAADSLPRFFTGPQLAALRRLSDVLMPPMKGALGALEAGVAEFLDFLLSESPEERQQIYRAGLDALNTQSQKKAGKPFAEVDGAQVAALLAPLREPWTYEPPKDPLEHFLRVAKQDVRNATQNSREYVTSSSAGRRRGAGSGLYWYPLD
jgi:hypothetical protein